MFDAATQATVHQTSKTPSCAVSRCQSQWQSLESTLKKEFGDTAWRTWFRQVEPRQVENGILTLAVPTRFVRDWIKTHYADRIRSVWTQHLGSLNAVDIEVDATCVAKSVPVEEQVTPAPVSEKVSPPANQNAGFGDDTAIENYSSPLDPRFTFDNFVVGKPNELAHAAARRVAESDGSIPFNPLFLYGGVGLGKTHLMHAIAHQIRQSAPHRKVLYLSAEKFMYQFIRALRFKDTMSFKEQLRSVDVLMIDDVQFISGKESTQEEFFHTFNALIDQHKQVVISADKSPSDLDGMEERLRSRLGWGLVADLHPTTYELRLGILEAKRDMLKKDIPQDVLEFLAHRITSNVRELEGALHRIAAHADLIGRPVTVETTQDLLQDLLRANDRRVSVEDIQKKVAEHYNIRVTDMHSPRRARMVARPRQIAMYLSKVMTEHSLPEIGRKFGGRDHTTIMHGVRKIEELCKTDSALAEDIALLQRAIAG